MSRTMKLTAVFEHDEKDPKHFHAAVEEFKNAVLTLGYRCDTCWAANTPEGADFDIVTSGDLPVGGAIVGDGLIVSKVSDGPDEAAQDEQVPKWAHKIGEWKSKLLLETPAVAEATPTTVKEVKAAIKRLKKATGGNKILSQTEMAETLGVSRYMIRKALK